MAIRTPSWRHETDFTVHGFYECEIAANSIKQNRAAGIFSKGQLDPYHMPFKYRGKWFDPHFSAPLKERRLHGAKITVLTSLSEKIFRITEDSDGLYYPAVYSVQGDMRLVTFRTSQRGLYRQGQRVYFESISLARIDFPEGHSERVYMVMDDEWGEIL